MPQSWIAQPGFVSAQFHRGIAGSSVFLNYAVRETVTHFRAAFANPEFQARVAEHPDTATVSPHLFRPVAIPGTCVARSKHARPSSAG